VVDGALRVEVLPLEASERSTAFQRIASAHLGRTVVPEQQNQSPNRIKHRSRSPTALRR